MAATDTWWAQLSDAQRYEYIAKHPDSKFASHSTATQPTMYHTEHKGKEHKHTFTLGVHGEAPHVYASVIEHPKHLYLDMLQTHANHRGIGNGRKMLRHVLKFADAAGKPVKMWSKALTGSNGSQKQRAAQELLDAFYLKHGFVDYHLGDANMIRPAKGKK